MGSRVWVVADGYIPPGSSGTDPALVSHESVCILNAGSADAAVQMWVYFTDREPDGPHLLLVPARRTFHQQLGRLGVPAGIDYSIVLRSDVPIVVQHTRLDSRQAANALMSTIAYPAE